MARLPPLGNRGSNEQWLTGFGDVFEGGWVFGRGDTDRLQGGSQLPAVQQARNRRVKGLNVGEVFQEGEATGVLRLAHG